MQLGQGMTSRILASGEPLRLGVRRRGQRTWSSPHGRMVIQRQQSFFGVPHSRRRSRDRRVDPGKAGAARIQRCRRTPRCQRWPRAWAWRSRTRGCSTRPSGCSRRRRARSRTRDHQQRPGGPRRQARHAVDVRVRRRQDARDLRRPGRGRSACTTPKLARSSYPYTIERGVRIPATSRRCGGPGRFVL